MKRPRRARILSAALLLGLAFSLGPNAVAAWSATPDPSSPAPSDGLTPTPQVELDLTDLASFVHDSQDVATSGAGFVGGIGDDADRAATLYFANPSLVPASVAAKAASLDLRITIKSAAYSLDALNQAMSRLQAKYNGTLPDGFKITFYQTFDSSGWSGLTLKGHYAAGSSATPDSATAADVAAVAQVPVRFVATPAAFTLYSGRAADFTPFFAGGVMQSAGTSSDVCSNGFAIVVAGSSHVTTATHCTANDYYGLNDPQSDSYYYGVNTLSQPDLSTGVRLLSRAGSPYTWSSTYNSLGNRAVSSVKSTLLNGTTVYTSGGNTGSHNEVVITGTGRFLYNGTWVNVWIGGESDPSVIASGEGDSGGPVFQLHLDGSVAAIGMIQGGTPSLTCAGENYVPSGSGPHCGSDVFFSSIAQAAQSVGGSVDVTP